eukprot:3665792-Amphidinium_carterae.1
MHMHLELSIRLHGMGSQSYKVYPDVDTSKLTELLQEATRRLLVEQRKHSPMYNFQPSKRMSDVGSGLRYGMSSIPKLRSAHVSYDKGSASVRRF